MGFGFVGGTEVYREVEKIPRSEWSEGLESAFEGAPEQAVAYVSDRGLVVIGHDPDMGAFRVFIRHDEMPDEFEVLCQTLRNAESLTAILLG